MTPEKKPNETRGWARVLQESAPYLTMGTTLAVSVLVGVLGGYWVDGKLGTSPLFLLLGSAFGLLAGGYHFYRSAMGLKR